MEFQKEDKVHYVEITCINGAFSYSKDNFEVDVGDFIEWSCDESNGEEYTINILKSVFEWKEKTKNCGQKIKDKIKHDAEIGPCKYDVSVNDGQNVWKDDPIFIVKRP